MVRFKLFMQKEWIYGSGKDGGCIEWPWFGKGTGYFGNPSFSGELETKLELGARDEKSVGHASSHSHRISTILS